MHGKTFEYFGLTCFDDSAQVSKLLLLILYDHTGVFDAQ